MATEKMAPYDRMNPDEGGVSIPGPAQLTMRNARPQPTYSVSRQLSTHGGATSSKTAGDFLLPQPAVTEKQAFLKTKFQVGSSKSDKLAYQVHEKVFHVGDVPPHIIRAKKDTNVSKKANILGVQKDQWDISTAANPRYGRHGGKQFSGQGQLRRTLQKVRAGLLDQKHMSKPKNMGEEEIADRIRHVVAITGKGPIGKFCGRWWNAVDERGLGAHCIDSNWPDWEVSAATQNVEDVKNAEAYFDKCEDRRKRMNVVDERVNWGNYNSLMEVYDKDRLSIEREKIEFQDLKDLFKKELRVEFPNACEERLQAMAQRLLQEKLLSDLKLQRFPVQHESFRPNLSLTSHDRRYKQFFHSGSWVYNQHEKKFAYSCCMNYKEDSKGCCYKIVNPDSWGLQGM